MPPTPVTGHQHPYHTPVQPTHSLSVPQSLWVPQNPKPRLSRPAPRMRIFKKNSSTVLWVHIRPTTSPALPSTRAAASIYSARDGRHNPNKQDSIPVPWVSRTPKNPMRRL